MWLHPKDKVTIGKQKLIVQSVEGLYSCVGVKVILKDVSSGETVSYPLLKFNELHDQGKIKVEQGIKRETRGY